MTARLPMMVFLAAVATSPDAPVIAQAAPPALPATLTNNPQITELWEPPTALAERDLFYGPWGAEHAPDPNAVYTFVAPNEHGINPGMTVRDPRGREWTIEQPPLAERGAKGAIDVVLSRVLTAVGFHQPPIYFLPSLKVARDGVVRTEPGGHLRLKVDALVDLGEWSWLENPYADSRPLHGLAVILSMFDAADLRDANNMLYQYTAPDGTVRRWFVVRNLGAAPGGTAHPAPVRITPADVRWASYLLSRLTPEQWQDAFRAAGYQPEASERVTRRIHDNLREGLALSETTVR